MRISKTPTLVSQVSDTALSPLQHKKIHRLLNTFSYLKLERTRMAYERLSKNKI